MQFPVHFILSAEESPVYLVTIMDPAPQLCFTFGVESVLGWENAFDLDTFQTEHFFDGGRWNLGGYCTGGSGWPFVSLEVMVGIRQVIEEWWKENGREFVRANFQRRNDLQLSG